MFRTWNHPRRNNLSHGEPCSVRGRAPRRAPTYRPLLETLEDRVTPTAGALDPTFGIGGTVTTPSFGRGHAVALQSDGKIVVVGSGGGNFAVARYNTDGKLDSAFDGDGKTTTDFGGIDEAFGVAIQADGKILVAGTAGFGASSDFGLARYNPDGSPDRDFDGDGKVTTDFAAGSDSARALALQADGKIVVAGFTIGGGSLGDFALARYNPDGSPDRAFDGDGKVTTNFADRFGAHAATANAVAVQADGNIVLAGSVFIEFNHFALTRYNTDGSLDSTFNGNGIVTTNFEPANLVGNDDQARSVAIQADGKIVAAGMTTLRIGTVSNIDFGLARYNPDGSPDVFFGDGGKRVVAISPVFGAADVATSVLIQAAGGRIVAAGFTDLGGFTDFALARFNSDGLLDASFGPNGNGTVTTNFTSGRDEASSMVLQADGKIVVAGSADGDFALARYEGVAPEIAVVVGGADLRGGSTLAFGTTPVGTPVSKTFTIRNLGNLSLSISSFSVPTGYQLTTATSFPIRLAAGAQTSMSVQLTAGTAGVFTGKVSIGNNDSDENPFLFIVTGTALAPAHEIQVLTGASDIPDNTGAVNFGTANIGETVNRTFTVRNIGNTNLTLGPGINVPTGFKVLSGFGSTTVAPGASTSFTVSLITSLANTFSGKVSFATNDSDENPFDFTVTGAVSSFSFAPKIRGESLTRHMDEDGVATVRGHLVDSDPLDELFLRIDWGDGSEPETHYVGHAPFAFEHRYVDDAPSDTAADEYLVHLTWFDSGGGSNSKALPVTVHNVAPKVFAGLPVLLQAGEALGRGGSFTDPGLDSWHATVDYGDSRGPQWLPLQTDASFTLNHSYSQPGVYHVIVRVFDDDGGVGTDTLAVTVLPDEALFVTVQNVTPGTGPVFVGQLSWNFDLHPGALPNPLPGPPPEWSLVGSSGILSGHLSVSQVNPTKENAIFTLQGFQGSLTLIGQDVIDLGLYASPARK